MDTEATRSLVRAFLAARAANDREEMGRLLADDVVWHLPRSLHAEPVVGRGAVVARLTAGTTGRYLDLSTLERETRALVVEGDTAVALQRLTAVLRRGGTYEQDFCWVYTCRDGRVARLEEHFDTLASSRLAGSGGGDRS